MESVGLVLGFSTVGYICLFNVKCFINTIQVVRKCAKKLCETKLETRIINVLTKIIMDN